MCRIHVHNAHVVATKCRYTQGNFTVDKNCVVQIAQDLIVQLVLLVEIKGIYTTCSQKTLNANLTLIDIHLRQMEALNVAN